MLPLGDIIKERIASYEGKTSAVVMKEKKSEYNARWNYAVDFFLKSINADRKKDGFKPLLFIVIRQKLVVLPEIDDLRWFYKMCSSYARTKDKYGKQNTFSKCFWGALK